MPFTYRNVVLRELSYAELDENFQTVETLHDETLEARDIAIADSIIYPDTTAGLAATAEGGYFVVPDTGTDELVFYREESGVAVEKVRIGYRAPYSGGTLTAALNEAPPVTIASAATTNIAGAASNTVLVSGTATITALGTIAAGAIRYVRATGAFTLTHNATSLILYGANIVATVGDVFRFESLGSGNWRLTGLQSTITAAGLALNAGADAAAQRTTLGVTNAGTAVIALKSSDQTAIGTAYADVTGTGLAVAANTTYAFEFHIIADADATTTGIDIACNGPAGATAIYYSQPLYDQDIVGFAEKYAAAYDSDSANLTSRGTEKAIMRIKGVLINGATAGTLIARAKREAVGTGPNVRAGSYGLLTKLS